MTSLSSPSDKSLNHHALRNNSIYPYPWRCIVPDSSRIKEL